MTRQRQSRPEAVDRGAPLRLLRRRIVVVCTLLLLMLGALVGRLTQVQLVTPAAATQAGSATAEEAGLTTLPIPAIRGRILDRNGIPLVENSSYPALILDRAVLADLDDDAEEALFTALSAALATSAEDLQARTTSCGAPGAAPPPMCTPGSPAAPAILAGRLEPEEGLAIAERPELYPGVSVEAVPSRAYPHPEGVLAPHVLGYLGQATADDVADSNGLISDGDLVGRTGLEEQYDVVLRGTPGAQVIRTDPRGVPLEVVEEREPVSGQDVRTSLDVRIQSVAESALADQIAQRRRLGNIADSGAAVVLDLQDGGVLALASHPTYDPAVWVGGITSDAYAALTSPGSHHPLISRVTEAAMAPASTFKVISALATLKAGGSLDGTYSCPSAYRIGGREFRNFDRRDYGRVSLKRAIEVSCSTIFYDSAYRNWVALGGTRATDDAKDPFVTIAREFGLGTRTGVDLPGEASGRLPGRAWRKAQWEATKERTCERAESGYPEVADQARRDLLTAIAKENCESGHLYRGGDAANLSIGQGDVLATPLQMAQVFAAVATGGQVHTPRVAQALVDVRTGAVEEVEPLPVSQVVLDARTGAYLRDALRGVVTDGTAQEGFADFPLDEWPVSGKTGSAESGTGNDVSWFVSYAPADAPRYVVAVAITQAGLGSEAAVPVARTIHDALRDTAG